MTDAAPETLPVEDSPPLPPLGGARGDAWPAGGPPARGPDPGRWNAPVSALPGVGKVAAEAAEAMGIGRIGDLLTHLPARYDEYDEARAISELRAGEEATVRVQLRSIAVRRTRRRGLRIVSARVADATGQLEATWFNQDYLARVLSPGDELLLRGRVEAGSPRRLMVKAHEQLGRRESEGLHTEGLVPVYPATADLPTRRIREMVDAARPDMRSAVEILPAWMRDRLRLPGIADALTAVHFPRSPDEPRLGRRRLAVEELVVLQLGMLALQRDEARRRSAPPLAPTGAATEPLLGALPFGLTRDQRRCADEIAADLARPVPMRRLLQGEVGSGKTLVAALAMCQAAEAGHQAAILVPTETLAEQHIATLDRLLAPTGLTAVLITGRIPAAERDRRLMLLRTGTATIAVGTQALLSEGVAFERLGLAVIDEQHRFGVEQRQTLADQAAGRAGAGSAAHLLYMTATPIPRTLALTAFGDLTVSTIRSRPPGRSPVETGWVREEGREEAYERVRHELREGRQAYVICPLVDDGPDAEARSATAEAARLASGPFAAFSVGLAHGAQRPDEKRAAMAAFASGETDLLVATTVVEVGIDVPNATVMVIEDAERFGLAQLHQLRGRVGRGTHPGLCLVFAEPTTPEGERRLEALTQTTDGFRLAELDLEIRGEGSVLGLRQAGAGDLRFARLARNRRELAEARHLAKRALRDDPNLRRPEHRLLRAAVRQRFAAIPRLLEA